MNLSGIIEFLKKKKSTNNIVQNTDSGIPPIENPSGGVFNYSKRIHKKRLVIVLASVLTVVAGFMTMFFVQLIMSEKKDSSEVTLQVRNIPIPSVSHPTEPVNPVQNPPTVQEPSDNPSPQGASQTENKAPTQDAYKPAESSPAPQVETVAKPVSTPPAGMYNPFDYNYDREYAKKKSELLMELEIEEIKAKIREAQLRGKEKGSSGSSGRKGEKLPPIDSLPRINPQQNLSQQTAPLSVQQIRQEPKMIKITIPGYSGVVITSTERYVILNSGDKYKKGAFVSDNVYIDSIVGPDEVYAGDTFGHKFKMKQTSYNIQIPLK